MEKGDRDLDQYKILHSVDRLVTQRELSYPASVSELPKPNQVYWKEYCRGHVFALC